MNKDIDRMMSVCMYRDALGIRVDILAALPAFFVRNSEHLKQIKNGRYCIIDSIIFASYVAYEQTLHGAAYYYGDDIEKQIQAPIICNLAVIISNYYGIHGDTALEIIENRFSHFDYVINKYGGNPGENLDAISEAFGYIISQTINEGKYLPFYADSPIYINDIFNDFTRTAEIKSLIAGLIAYAGTLFSEERQKLESYK